MRKLRGTGRAAAAIRHGQPIQLALRLNLPVVNDGPSLAVAGETVTLRNWNDAPPATRHVFDRFAGLVGETARRLAAAHRLVDVERQARMIQSGEPAATVVHDLRNPLGIVTMATTGAPSEVAPKSANRSRGWITSLATTSIIRVPAIMQLRGSDYLHDVMRGNDGALDNGGSEESGIAEMEGKADRLLREEDVITGLPMAWLEVHPRNRQPAGSVAVGGRCAR